MKINETRESVRTEGPDRTILEVCIKAGTVCTRPEPSKYKEIVVMIQDRTGETGRVRLSAGDLSFWSELTRLCFQHGLINRETLEYIAAEH